MDTTVAEARQRRHLRSSRHHSSSSSSLINLKGITVGDGWVDPVMQMAGYPDQMFNLGLADEKQTAEIKRYCNQTIRNIQAGNMGAAFDAWDKMLNGDVWKYPTYFYNVTHATDYDNFMRTAPPASFDTYSKFLNQPRVRASLHAGGRGFGVDAHTCELHLRDDFMKSMKPRLQVLLDATEPRTNPFAPPQSKYRVLIYNGQLDIIIGAPLTELFIPTMKWHGASAYAETGRAVWKVNADDVEVAGYVREVENLVQVVVRGAGHIAPADQPERVLDMIRRFISGESFSYSE